MGNKPIHRQTKRITIFFLAVMFLCTSINSISIYAAQQTEMVVSYSFNDLVTNATATSLNIKGDSYYVKKYQDHEKGLYINLNGSNTSIEVPASLKEDFLVAFDMQSVGTEVTATVQLKSSSKTFNALQIKNSHSVCTYDNNNIGCLSANQLNRIELLFHGGSLSYDIYINGKAVAANYYAGSYMPSSIATVVFGFSSDQEESGVLIDNINMAHTSVIPDQYPYAAWNDEEIPLDLSPPSVGTAIMMQNDFSKTTSGMGITKNDHIWEITEREDGTSCLLIEKTNDESSRADVSVSGEQYRYIVLETSIQLIDAKSRLLLGVMKSDTSKWETLVNINGKSVLAKGRQIATLSTSEFTKLAFALDTTQMTFDAYVNGELVLKDGDYNLDGNLIQLRVEVPADGSCKLYMNEYNIYEGKEPRDLSTAGDAPSYDTSVNMFHDYTAQEIMLKDKVGLHIRSGVLTSNGSRKILNPAPYVEDGHTMVPVRAVSEAFNLPVKYDETTSTVTIDERISFTVGQNIMIVDGNEITLEIPAVEKEDRTFLPLRALCEQGLSKQVYYDDTTTSSGMVIISDKKFNAPEDPDALQQLNNYLFYYRPSEEELLAIFKQNNETYEHPRLHTNTERLEEMKMAAEQSETLQTWLNTLIASADSRIAGEFVPFDYDVSSGRLNYSTAEGLPSIAIGYLLTKDSKYIDRAWQIMSTYCSWDNWFPDHYLDTAITANAIAIAYDWMYDGFTPEQRKVIEDGLYRNALREALLWQYGVKSSGSNNSWPYMYNNWNEVCNGSMITVALALMDVYPEEASRVLANCFKGLEFSLFYYAPDGAWFEGPVYWEFGTSYLISALSTLETVMGTTFALDKAEGISNTADYGLDGQSSLGTFNFADADEYDSNTDYQFWLARHFDKPEVTNAVLHNTKGGIIGLSPLTPLFADWTSLEKETEQRPYDAYFGGNTQIITMRDSWESEETYLATKGGVEAHSHGHMDIGGFVFDSMGERWAAELGVENYSVPGFWNIEGGKWKCLRNRAEGHNTLIINPDGTGIDHTLYAESEAELRESKPKGAIGVVDMSEPLSAYTESARRGFFLTDYRKSLVVRDELELTDASEIYWMMYTKAMEGKIDGNSVILTQNGKKLRMDFLTNGNLTLYYEEAKAMEGMPTVLGETDNSAFRRVRAKITGSGTIHITVKLTPIGIYSTDVSEYNISIDDWHVPDGEITETPTIDNLMLDGVPVENFTPSQTTVTASYILGDTHVPQVNATSEQYRIAIDNAESLDDVAVVKVYSNEDENYYNAYIVGFIGLAPAPDFTAEGVQTWQIYNVTASAEPQPVNKKENAFDNDFNTRWSAQGIGDVWIQADLGEVRTVNQVYLATWLGAAKDGRKMFFSISLSQDGENFETVYDGSTSGTTEDYELFEFEQRDARYIRINCGGTTTGDWNSILELVVGYKG
ncbi:stalk domain-containing protein [Ructibacterium gallinarum]|uniref:Discoidin domain-containing protein n=1 Tax=Ructibacterium gallinarum TaxID=2779355 RepID=A0A9D5R8S4_9FIRM|nr:stalk domain-containing protein [Ructibacterium gallinarum]MBE5040300.1 discoidin domain-containing protein [Ructibacterium gallinarum]